MKKFMRKNLTYGGFIKLSGIIALISIIFAFAEFIFIFKRPIKIKNEFSHDKHNKDNVEEFKS